MALFGFELALFFRRTKPHKSSQPLIIRIFTFILLFRKLGLFFQIKLNFSSFSTLSHLFFSLFWLFSLRKLALFFQTESIQLVSRPTRGNRHPVNAPKFSDLGFRASDFRPKAGFGFVFSNKLSGKSPDLHHFCLLVFSFYLFTCLSAGAEKARPL